MEDISFSTAAEIVTNPHDLSFAISGHNFVIARGPDNNNAQKILVSSRNLKNRKILDPVECIRYCLVSSVRRVEDKLRTRDCSFSELLEYSKLPFEDMTIIRDDDIEEIVEKLKASSPNGLFETFERYSYK